jgi:hypothetical protein
VNRVAPEFGDQPTLPSERGTSPQLNLFLRPAVDTGDVGDPAGTHHLRGGVAPRRASRVRSNVTKYELVILDWASRQLVRELHTTFTCCCPTWSQDGFEPPTFRPETGALSAELLDPPLTQGGGET